MRQGSSELNTHTPAADATTRFSTKVDNYIRYRPGYPPEMLDCLAAEFGLRPQHKIVDLGSGTGISSEVFLRNGNAVVGVEPNEKMREAGDRLLSKYPNFRSVCSTAEATTLPDSSVDWVVAGQAFHWFDVPRARRECKRILRPPGPAVLVWNDRREDTPFLVAYELLLREFSTDYLQIKHENAETDGRVDSFYCDRCVSESSLPAARSIDSCRAYSLRTFRNQQVFDFDGVRGRTLSSSYVILPDHPRFGEMLTALRSLFDEHAVGGTVTIEYETRMYVGDLSPRRLPR